VTISVLSAVAPVSPTPQGPLSVSNLGSANITINYGTANDSGGVAETVNPSTGIVTAPAHGTASNVSPGVFQYANTDGTVTTDSFVVAGGTATCAGADATACSPATSGPGNNITVNVNIQPSNVLTQIIVIPVTGADLTMGQPGRSSVTDLLDHTVAGSSCSGPAIRLNGKPQNACGALRPITVVNARGTDASWSLTGQISDFLDASVPPTTTCDTPASYSNHCIPGGNLSWGPLAAVAHDVVPGDVAQVTAGPAVAPPAVLAAVLQASGPLAGTKLQASPVAEPAPTAGLHNGAQTLCSTASTQSGGTFDCGANLVVAVPASAFAPGAPGYQATLTLTLA